MADGRREARHERYVRFNSLTDAPGRVMNIEDAFDNLPHRLCLPLQWMNESINNEDWRVLTEQIGIDPLNHTMLLSYQVSLLSLLLSFLLFFFHLFLFC